jgi:organic hydroperoxide reductase OsmC/OhrA
VKQHTYTCNIEWIGNDGEGTKTYRSYRRDHIIACEGKAPISASSDPSFRGDSTRYNPEELLVAGLSSCHMLSYLHLCAVNNINVVEYRDHAEGIMRENPDGSGEFIHVTLKPEIEIATGGDLEKATELHHKAHSLCFIARSVNFPVDVAPVIRHKKTE